jgi:glycosyltransferase involved in cell wall biosynthesis
VVEDGSEDRTVEVALSYAPDVRLVQREPAGIGAARNTAVEESRCELVAFLDCDDLWDEVKLERQVGAMDEDRSLDFCFTYAEEFASPDDAQRYAVRPDPLAGALASSLLARREAIAEAGGFDEGVAVGELLGWLARAREGGMGELMLEDVLVRRRIHADNMTRRLRGDLGDYARVLKRSIDRRRAAT